MDDAVQEKYRRAGRAAKDALALAEKIARPGVPLIEVCDRCEQVIREQGLELAFPLNISLDDIAAHYSSPVDDAHVLPEHGLVKVDLGAHCDGYVSDAARTINLGNDGGVHETLCTAAREALEKAIEAFRPGQQLHEIGRIIHAEITKHDVKPISNLGGHSLEQYNLHAGQFVPNVPDTTHDYVIQEGDAFAIEPFTTNGYGAITNGRDYYIYRFRKLRKKNIPMREYRMQVKMKKRFSTLPFSPRWIDFIPKGQLGRVLKRFLAKGILEKYWTLVERQHGLVAQWENTVIVHADGAEVTTA